MLRIELSSYSAHIGPLSNPIAKTFNAKGLVQDGVSLFPTGENFEGDLYVTISCLTFDEPFHNGCVRYEKIGSYNGHISILLYGSPEALDELFKIAPLATTIVAYVDVGMLAVSGGNWNIVESNPLAVTSYSLAFNLTKP